jgi:hypothetical protein
MVLQVITPQQETFDLPISLPKTYLGKKVHCIFYIEEEATNVMATAFSTKKPSDFFGILTKEESKKFEKHIKQMRIEWERDI